MSSLKHTNAIDLPAWRSLYEVAEQIKKLAPWKWMNETDVFGVRFPGTNDIGYVSVMGGIGQHFAVSVYLGNEALHMFNDLQSQEPGHCGAELLLEIPQLMASFEDRDALEAADRSIIKRLGLKFRGANQWPLFRSYRPGFYPWFLEKGEVEKLTVALRQALTMAMLIEDNPDVLRTDNANEYLVRTSRSEGDGVIWENSYEVLAEPESFELNFLVDVEQFKELQTLPRNIRALEADFFIAPGGIQKSPGERPALTYLLLAVETGNGCILGAEVLTAQEGLRTMWGEMPGRLISVLHKNSFMPRQIRVASPLLYNLLSPLKEDTGIDIVFCNELPAADDARAALMHHMQNEM